MMSKRLRPFPISALVYLALALGAHATRDASMICKRIEQLPTVSDGQILAPLEAYAKAFGGSKPLLVRHVDNRFFMALPDDESCKSSSCYYRLLDLKDGEVKERFSFKGTGVILFFLTHTHAYIDLFAMIDHFQDHFAMIALATSAGTHIRVGLPRTGNTVLVEAIPPEPFRLPTC